MKKILLGFFLCGFSFFLVAVVLSYLAFSAKTDIASPSALIITIDGPLVEGDSDSLEALLAESPPLSLHSVSTAIREAAVDDRISGIILNIVDPQLGMAQIQEIEEAMSQFRMSEKWTIAFMESAGVQSRGDGAYALALCAQEIYLAPPGSLNIIGLRSQSPFFAGLFEKLSIKPFFDRRKEFKSGPDVFTREGYSPKHREQLSDILSDLQITLEQHIAKRRNVNSETARTWINEGPYSATDAKAKGMVDQVAYFDSVRDELRKRIGRDNPTVSIHRYMQSLMPNLGQRTIALITAAGTIHRGRSDADPLSSQSSIGSTTYTKAFRKAREDKVSGVLFRIDSGGGSYVASDLIRREVELTRKAGIPVVVSMGNVAASGGYFIAMDANHIVAQPSTITGSIGVYSGGFATREFFKNYLGITFDSFNASPNADIFETLDPPDKRRQALLKTTLDRIYKDFVGKMASARNKTFAQADKVAKGRIWSGKKAKEQGLIDELGGMNTALDRLKILAKIAPEESILFQSYPIPDTPWAIARKTLTSGSKISTALRNGIQNFLLTIETSQAGSLYSPPLELLP